MALLSEYSTLQRNVPILCVKTFEEVYYTIVKHKKGGSLTYILINLIAQKVESLSINYHRIEIHALITDNDLGVFDVSSISNFLLPLPEFEGYGYKHGNNLSLYYIIDSEWNGLLKDM